MSEQPSKRQFSGGAERGLAAFRESRLERVLFPDHGKPRKSDLAIPDCKGLDVFVQYSEDYVGSRKETWADSASKYRIATPLRKEGEGRAACTQPAGETDDLQKSFGAQQEKSSARSAVRLPGGYRSL